MSNQPTVEDKVRVMSMSLELVQTNVRNHNYAIPGNPKKQEDIITINVPSVLTVYDQLLSKILEEQSPEKKYLDRLINMFNTGQRELENHIARPDLNFKLALTLPHLNPENEYKLAYAYTDSITKEEIENIIKR